MPASIAAAPTSRSTSPTLKTLARGSDLGSCRQWAIQPIVVRANLKQSQDVNPPDVFFVVMHTQQYGPSGPTFWSISVYRLTVFHRSKQQIQNETPAKST